ncbi:hypothetical protein H4582DRAFT_2129938 [Lactarius indigo]|nr:hypothetical protein H4582DRAFT_2129938 [Lactarius indigo]
MSTTSGIDRTSSKMMERQVLKALDLASEIQSHSGRRGRRNENALVAHLKLSHLHFLMGHLKHEDATIYEVPPFSLLSHFMATLEHELPSPVQGGKNPGPPVHRPAVHPSTVESRNISPTSPRSWGWRRNGHSTNEPLDRVAFQISNPRRWYKGVMHLVAAASAGCVGVGTLSDRCAQCLIAVALAGSPKVTPVSGEGVNKAVKNHALGLTENLENPEKGIMWAV